MSHFIIGFLFNVFSFRSHGMCMCRILRHNSLCKIPANKFVKVGWIPHWEPVFDRPNGKLKLDLVFACAVSFSVDTSLKLSFCSCVICFTKSHRYCHSHIPIHSSNIHSFSVSIFLLPPSIIS